MKITKEINAASDFEFWSGGADTVKYLTNDEVETVLSFLEECYPDGMTETQLNDFFWFECDEIAQMLGYNDFEEITKREI